MKYEKIKKSRQDEVGRDEVKKSSFLQNSEFRLQKGVALYLAIVVMTILLAIGLGLTTILLAQLKVVRGMGNSVLAIYAADTGIERALFNPTLCTVDCSGTLANKASYSVVATPGGSGGCSLPFSWCIKSVGKFGDSKRAIEVNR